MVIRKGEIWWAALEQPIGSAPGYIRPVLVIQADSFNQTNLKTAVVAVLSSNLNLGAAPGNVFLGSESSGLPKDSVVNVSQLQALDKNQLTQRVGMLDILSMDLVERGLRLVLDLS